MGCDYNNANFYDNGARLH